MLCATIKINDEIKTMKGQFIIIIFSLLQSISVAQSIVGYYDNEGRRRHTLELNKDSSFVQYNRDCTYDIQTTGNWIVKQDTLILKLNKMYSFGSRKTKYEMGKESTNFNLANSMTKYIIKKDTIVLLWGTIDSYSYLPRIVKKRRCIH